MRTTTRVVIALTAASLSVPLASGVAEAGTTPHRPGPVVVVSGLNNPRQLSLVNDNVLLVAEAGKGGTLATFGSPEQGMQGLGRTGSISAVVLPQYVKNQHPHRIISGLLSAAAPDGSGAVGPDGVSARSLLDISIQETAFPPDIVPASDAKTNGALLESWFLRKPQPVADIAGFEQRYNPDRQAIDTDPYAVLQLSSGDRLVADAAGNDVLRVDRWGHRTVFHAFRNIVNATCLDPALQQPPPDKPGCQFVPTSLATDRYGHIFVGALAGLVPGQGRVVELSADGRHELRTWTGLTSVTGVAVSEDGSLYASQLFAPEQAPANPALQGVLTKISRNGHRTNVDVPFPAGVAVDKRGNVYVSAFSIAPDTGLLNPETNAPIPNTSGQVWRLCF